MMLLLSAARGDDVAGGVAESPSSEFGRGRNKDEFPWVDRED